MIAGNERDPGMDGGSMRILIAEDDPVSQRLFKRLLAPFGECHVARTGREAVDAFKDALEAGRPYELICLDIMMPVLDGQAALKLIRQRERECGIQREREAVVIMVTALDAPRDVIEAFYRRGCTGYLVKPILKDKLLAALKDCGLGVEDDPSTMEHDMQP